MPTSSAACAAGDREAFQRLYARYADPVFRFCGLRLRDTDASSDALQETFLAVWTGSRGYRGTGPVVAWLLGIARRLLIGGRHCTLKHRRLSTSRDKKVLEA